MCKSVWYRNAMALICIAGCMLLVGCSCIKTGEGLLHLIFDRPDAIEEADSSEHILALEIEKCDYIIRDDFVRANFRQEDRRASIGTAKDGMYFDGEAAYRYLDGDVMPMEDFPWKQVDDRANEYLSLIQTIVQKGYFRSYNEEPNSTYFGQHFYYAVSPEGMELISDPRCENALIISKYRDGDFQYVTLYLYDADRKLRGTYDIGTLDHSSSILPPQQCGWDGDE